MNANARSIPTAATRPDPATVKRDTMRLALISLGLLITLVWNGALIFEVGRLIHLW
jgi:hypothetical protein